MTDESQQELRNKVVKYLSIAIVGRTKDWDHMSRDQKEGDVSHIKNEEKRLFEMEFCVLRDRPCHRFKTIFETNDPKQQSANSVHVMNHIKKWKRDRFEENDSCCTLLADIFGEGVSCPFGYGTSAECAAHIKRVGSLLEHKQRDDNPLDFYLSGCFDTHHKDPRTKKGKWMDMRFEEMKELLDEQGMLTCICCHAFVTALLRQDRQSSD